MTRLRVKGAALRNSLYQLTNGYVTISQTVKVRPGTFRHTDLGATSGLAGKTFGLTYFDGTFHIFAAEELTDIPAGYTLHVLNHPAAQQEVTGSIVDLTMVAQTATGVSGFGTPHGIVGSSMTPSTFTDSHGVVQTIISFICQGTFQFQMTLNGSVPRDAFESVQYTDKNGANFSLDSATSTAYTDGGTSTTWFWTVSTGGFTAGVTYHPAITVIPTGTFAPIALKEIHFAAPFMGFLYVAAEFDVDSATRDAWGDTFHYWIQTSGEWAADTVYQVGQIVSPSVANGFQYQATRISSPNPGWTPNTPEVVDNIVEPTTPNGYYFTAIETDGANPTTGASEPTWPTSTGATVAEDTTVGGNDVVASAAPQPPTNVPSPGTGTKYTNPYSLPSKSL